MDEVTCPGCGGVARLEPGTRAADAFCPACDYPLFWAVPPTALGDDQRTGAGLRRLPGTVGRVTLGTITCWQCQEHNPVTGTICVRCGADLSGPPPAPIPEPPPPAVEPPPPPAPPAIWPYIYLALFVAAITVALVVQL